MMCNCYFNPLPEGYIATIFICSCLQFGHPYTLKNASKAVTSVKLILQKQTCKTCSSYMLFVYLLTFIPS